MTEKKLSLSDIVKSQDKIRKEVSKGSPDPDNETAGAQKDLDYQQKAAEIQGLKQNIDERKKYAKLIYKLIRNWLIGIFLLILSHGICSILGYILFSDKVLIAIIGGTTINVLGLFAIVVRYLFKAE